MNKLIHITLFISFVFSQQYNVGDTIGEEHLNMTFDVCYGDIEDVTFDDYKNNSVIWLNFVASW